MQTMHCYGKSVRLSSADIVSELMDILPQFFDDLVGHHPNFI